MAKISLTKIADVKIPAKTVKFNDEIDFTVIQYLPIEDKINLLERVVNKACDSTGFVNPLLSQIHFAIEMVKEYLNLNITEKQSENTAKLYDKLLNAGVINFLWENLPEGELNAMEDCFADLVDFYNTYNMSAAGVVKAISGDYMATQTNVDEIVDVLGNPDSFRLIQETLQKLG